jgi:hypothetical protein
VPAAKATNTTGVAVQHSSTGSYLVSFGRDITQCSPLASIGGVPLSFMPGVSSGSPAGATINVNMGSIGTPINGFTPGEGVNVLTYDSSAAPVDSSFEVAVLC